MNLSKSFQSLCVMTWNFDLNGSVLHGRNLLDLLSCLKEKNSSQKAPCVDKSQKALSPLRLIILDFGQKIRGGLFCQGVNESVNMLKRHIEQKCHIHPKVFF